MSYEFLGAIPSPPFPRPGLSRQLFREDHLWAVLCSTLQSKATREYVCVRFLSELNSMEPYNGPLILAGDTLVTWTSLREP